MCIPLSASAIEHFLGFGVGKSLVGVDDGFSDGVVMYFSRQVDVEDHGEASFVFAGTEGAVVVRQAFGEHGQDAIDEVDGVAAAQGFSVEGGVFGDVVADVGDVDAYLIDVVVEVLY